jgi:drug/metabolite transporter (DMT)-like permease
MNNNTKGILFAIFTALMWGLVAIALKLSLTDLSSIEVTWVRFSIAFLLLFLYIIFKQPSEITIFFRPPLALIFASIFLGFNYLGFITGVQLTTPSIAQVFIQVGPALLALSGFFFFKEKIGKTQIVGLIIVLFGLIIFYREQILYLTNDITKYQKGALWTVFGAIMWASYAVLQKGLVKKIDPIQLNLFLFGIPALGYLPFVNFPAIFKSSLPEWGLLLFLGLNTILSYISLSYAFKYLEANKVSVIITLNPLLTFLIMGLLGVLQVSWIAHENFTLITIGGASLVLIGAVLTIFRRKNRLQPIEDN